MPLNDYVLVIADDDPEILAAYVAMLEPKGFAVHTCRDGEEAMELCPRVQARCCCDPAAVRVMNKTLCKRSVARNNDAIATPIALSELDNDSNGRERARVADGSCARARPMD